MHVLTHINKTGCTNSLNCTPTSYYRCKAKHAILPLQPRNSSSNNTSAARASRVHIMRSRAGHTPGHLLCMLILSTLKYPLNVPPALTGPDFLQFVFSSPIFTKQQKKPQHLNKGKPFRRPHCSKRACKKGGQRCLTRSCSDRTKDGSFKEGKGRFRPGIGRNSLL